MFDLQCQTGRFPRETRDHRSDCDLLPPSWPDSSVDGGMFPQPSSASLERPPPRLHRVHPVAVNIGVVSLYLQVSPVADHAYKQLHHQEDRQKEAHPVDQVLRPRLVRSHFPWTCCRADLPYRILT